MPSSKKPYVITRDRSSNIEGIEEKLRLAALTAVFWKEVKYNFKRFTIYGIINLTLLMLGSLGFFYIEHCHSFVPKTLNVGEGSFMRICNEYLPQMDTANNTTVNIQMLCDKNKQIVLDERECQLTTLEFLTWMEYTFSVAFTLGYGRVVTRTDFGKMMTIAYAIPMIALSSITYVYCGNMVKNFAKVLIIYVEVRFLKHHQVKRLTLKTVFLELFLCITLIAIFTLFFMMSSDMNLNSLDSFYFVMVTLLTIGFGDIVVDLDIIISHPQAFIAGNVIFIFGLGMLASLITSLAELRNKEVPVTSFLKKASKQIKPKLMTLRSQKSQDELPTVLSVERSTVGF